MVRINNNVQAFNAYRNLSMSQMSVGKNLEKLSSGFRINRAADDAAGLVTSENLRAKLGGLKVASRNAQDGISVAQTAEGALDEVATILRRMRDLAVQSSSTGSNDSTALAANQSEVDQLEAALNDIFDRTKFGDKALFSSGAATSLVFQVGTEANQTTTLTVATSAVGATNLGVNLLTMDGSAAAAITSIDAAISAVSALRGDLGAFQNRMESTIRNLGVTIENLSAAESRIRDTDMALETVEFTKNQILQQAGTAMLAQANATPQSVLRLLG